MAEPGDAAMKWFSYAATIAQEGTSMQRKRRMLTASRLCLLGIAVSASSSSVFGQCPNDANCDAQVRSITALGGSQVRSGVWGQNNSGWGGGWHHLLRRAPHRRRCV